LTKDTILEPEKVEAGKSWSRKGLKPEKVRGKKVKGSQIYFVHI
jgi:hypothetical protein